MYDIRLKIAKKDINKILRKVTGHLVIGTKKLQKYLDLADISLVVVRLIC